MKTINELYNLIKGSDNELEKVVLTNNYNAVLYNDDVMNAVITEFNKYAGKKIGEMTMKKINAALNAAVPGLRVYIPKEYDETRKYIHVIRDIEKQYISSYEDNVEICWTYNHRNTIYLFDENSNFIKLDPEHLQFINKRTYIEDVPAYIEKKINQFKAIKALENDYNELCKLFDSDKVKGLSGFQRLYTTNYITK